MLSRRVCFAIATRLVATTSLGQDAPIEFETARHGRRLVAKRASGDVLIDAVLDESDWADPPVATDFNQNDPRGRGGCNEDAGCVAALRRQKTP